MYQAVSDTLRRNNDEISRSFASPGRGNLANLLRCRVVGLSALLDKPPRGALNLGQIASAQLILVRILPPLDPAPSRGEKR